MPGVMVGGGGIMVLGSYSGLGLGPLIPVKGTLNNLGYQSIPISSTKLCSNRSAHQCTKRFGVEELDWPAYRPGNELEWRLQAKHSRPSSVTHIINALLEEC